MDFKFLCSDLDGTLLTTKSDVSSYTISQINRIKEQTRVILASARMPSAMHYLQKSLGIEEHPIICYNGALILEGKKELLSVFIPLDIITDIYGICTSFRTEIGLYVNDQWYVSNSSERVEKEIKYTKTKPSFMTSSSTLSYLEKKKLGAHKLMLMGTKKTADELMPILHDKFGMVLHLYRSNDSLIEVAPKSVSKLSAIKVLLGEQDNLKDIIAFGDNYNDIEMLKYAGVGVAVGNARAEVKAIADHVTLSNTEDGVAHYIKQYLSN